MNGNLAWLGLIKKYDLVIPFYWVEYSLQA